MGTTGQSITLANSIIGVGVLAMPFCFQQCGIVLATLILLFMGLVSRLCCYFLLKSALLARRNNFEYLAHHVFGPAGKMVVELGIIGYLMGTCIAYFVVVGDLGPQIVSKLFNINQSDILRTSIMVIVSLVCVLPLGLLRNVDSLSNVSAATIGFYICLVLKVVMEALWSSAISARVEAWRPAGLLQCVPIFSMALFCQTQLFEIFESMPSLSLEKMNLVTKNAINICAGVYFTLGLSGYLAFSTQTISGNILMSLSPTMASDVIKLGFVMSLAFSFPLIIFPCRASLYSFLYKKGHTQHHDHLINNSIPKSSFRFLTVAIIAVSLCISLLIPNIELVLGLVGSTIGVLICVVFPAACFVNVTYKETNERILAKLTIVLGLIILVLGTYANLEAAERLPRVYSDEIYTQEKIDRIVEDFIASRKKEKIHSEGNIDAIAKPEVDRKDQEVVINQLEVIKDSEVQPPNPVPPESLHEEKVIKPPNGDSKIIKEQLFNEEIEVKPRAEEPKPINIEENSLGKDENIPKVEKNVPQLEEPNKLVPKPEQNIVPEKIEIKNQEENKIMEVIKANGEEQKELIKEQQELLQEIRQLKTVEKDKEIEAKKIAVENIAKIANVAIKSLSAAEKDTNQNEKSIDTIANVEEIAKKAVQSIVAINELDEKPKIELGKESLKLLDFEPIKNYDLKPENIKNEDIPSNHEEVVKNIKTVVKESIAQEHTNVQSPDKDSKFNAQVLSEKQPDNIDQNVNANAHSHSADEPQSYKNGEDAMHKVVKTVASKDPRTPDVPIALVMSDNTKLAQQQSIVNKKEEKIADSVGDGEKENINLRKRREILDINHQKIDNLPIKSYQEVDLLPKVDIGNDRSFANAIVHSRSLRSIKQEK